MQKALCTHEINKLTFYLSIILKIIGIVCRAKLPEIITDELIDMICLNLFPLSLVNDIHLTWF